MVHPAAQALIDDIGGYAELSPSGHGVRIPIFNPKLADEYRKLKHTAVPWRDYVAEERGKPGEVEVYEGGQFGSMTGNVILDAPIARTADVVFGRYPKPGNPTDHATPSEPVSPEMDDDEVLRRLRSGRNGAYFSKLYDNPPSADEDASAGDQSLFSLITFYTQDRAQIERIAFESERVRDKWGREDYIRRTIDKALQRSDFWQPSGTYAARFKAGKGDASGHKPGDDPFAFVDLTTVPTEPPDMLVEGLISRGSVVSIYSGAGTGKTWTALYALAQTVARGEKVVYVDKENGARIMRERLELMGVNLEANKHLIRYIPFPTAGLDDATVEAWAAMLDREKPALVIFDSWIGFLASCGLDENSSNDVATWADKYATPAARERGVAVLILDHEPKAAGNKTARGSSRKLDYVDAQFKQTVTAPFDRSTVGSVKLSKQKDREGWLPSALHFRTGGKRGELNGSRIGRDSFVFSPVDMPDSAPEDGLNAGERATLGALVDCMSYAEWRDASGKASSTFNLHRDKLVRLGLVVRDEDAGTYSRPQLQSLQEDSNGSSWSDRQDRPYDSNYSNYSTSWSSWSTDGVDDNVGQSVVDNDDHAKPATVPAGDAPVESYRPLAANVDTDALRLEISRGAFDAENPHRKGGWTRTIARPGIETATLLDDVWEQYPYARDAVTRVLDSLTGGLGVVKALDDLYDVLDDALAAITICERVEMHACFHAGGFDMYGDACPLVWRDDALAAPAGNDAATKFVSRRIAELQRDGYYVEAVRLMDEIPPPDDPGDDALAVEWATVHEPSIHRFNETLAYAHYAEHVTGYPMGGAL